MGELSLDNILDFSDTEDFFGTEEEVQDISEPEKTEEKNLEEDETVEIDPENLFSDESESVDSGKDSKEKEDASSKKDGSSPTFYSSIAKALKEEGVFPDLEDEVADSIKDPEDFRDIIEQQIKASLDERQRRIDEALNAGIEPTEIKKYENTISYLDSIKESDLTAENDKGEELRKQLIYQDFINRGYSKERAIREINKSLQAGTDLEDAKEALKSNRDFFQEQYDDLVNEAKAEEEKEIKLRKEQGEALKKSILEDKKVFGELVVDNKTRQKIYDNIAKPVYKDPDTGELYTALQKYERDNKVDFLKNLGLVYTLTDGFKNLDGLVKGKVSKEVKRGLRELEHTLNNTARTSGGSIKFVSNVDEDSEAFITKGWSLDV